MRKALQKNLFSVNISFLLFLISFLTSINFSKAQSSILWSSSGGSAWLTASNWTGSVVPTSTDIAQMGANPTGAGGIGINMNGATNNGLNNQIVGAFEMTSARVTSNPVIGNSSTAASGTLTLIGTTVNALPNVIIRNNSAKNITFQNTQGSGSQTMNIAITNSVNSIILQDTGGNIVISSAIIGGTNCPLTVQGLGNGEVDITNSTNSFSGPINLLASETVFSADGCYGAVPASIVSNAITIDGGRMTANATFTLNANRGIKIGSSAGTSISVKTGTSVLTYNGVMSDLTSNGSWSKQGSMMLQLGGINGYSGSTSINNGVIQLINGDNRLPVTTTLNIGQAGSANVGNFDLNGFNQTISGLNSTNGTNLGVAKNTVTTSSLPSILTINTSGNFTFGDGTTANSGVISGSVSIIKNGVGLQVFGDLNTYSGSTTINAGELRFSPNANESLNSSSVILNGGTLGTAGTSSNVSITFSTLALTDNSIINLEATNIHTLNFATSNGISWTALKTLTISGWQGTYNSLGTSGTVGSIFVGTGANDLTAGQLSQIIFYNGINYYPAKLLATGELVPYCVAPVLNSVTSNTSLCAGASLNLTANATGTYAPSFFWSGPNSFTSTIQNPSINNTSTLSSGIYTITAANICGNASSTLAVTVNSLPSVIANSTSVTICSGQQITLSGSGANTYSWTNGINNGVAFIPTASAIYSVTGTDNNNCVGSAAISITVITTPTVSVNSSTICAGNTITITAAGANTYSWSNNANTTSIVISPSATAIYTVTGTSAICSANNTATVIVNPLPILSVPSVSICLGGTATLSAIGAATYSWNTGSTSNSITPSPTVTTNYTLMGSSAQGCTSFATSSIIVTSSANININSTSICFGNTATLSAFGVSTYTWNNGATTSAISVTPSITTVYTVSGNASGCSVVAMNTATITVNPLPIITVSSASICIGNSASLTASGATSYTWNTGIYVPTLIDNPTSTTVYSISGLSPQGCFNLTTATITVNALPNVSLAVANPTLCISDNTLALNGSPTGGSYSGNGVAGGMFNPSVSGVGNFTVSYSYSDMNGCSNSVSKIVAVDLCTSLRESSLTKSISVFPNPASNVVTLFLSNFERTYHVTVLNLMGQNLYNKISENASHEINITSFDKGLYILKISEGNSVIISKFIKD